MSKTKKRLFRPLRASDAHTDGEDRLYKAMWAKARECGPGVRELSASIRVLADSVGRDERNTRPVVDSLIRKLSITIAREQDYRTGAPRRYIVYDYSQISARRRQAGLEWALKNKGIQLLSTQEATVLAQTEVSTSADSYTPVSTPVDTINPTVSTLVNTPDLTPVESVVSTPADSSGLSLKEKTSTGNNIQETPSTAIVRALLESAGHSDDNAAIRLGLACRKKAPDATDDEIIYFIRQQGARFSRMKGIENLMGMLIRQVPLCFEGESFRQYRETVQKQHEAEQQQEIETARDILRNPKGWSEDFHRWARQILEQNAQTRS
ncbi:MAG: hypothetical protein ABSG25_08440 [Bryobacteraceae bacterium]